MKKIFFLAILLLQLSFAKTQTYYPFPDSNAVWVSYLECQDSDAQCINLDSARIYYDGDTVINGYNYKKLRASVAKYSYYDPFCMCGGSAVQDGWLGFLRQDIPNRKVYLKNYPINPNDPFSPCDTSEVLLYDFTLNIGDTLKGPLAISWHQTPTPVVIKIDSVLIGGGYRRVIVLDTNYHCSAIIEGIGSVGGLLEPLGKVNYFTVTVPQLICFEGDTFKLTGTYLICGDYMTFSDSCSLLVTNSDRAYYFKNPILIYPNPTDERIIINSEKHYLPLKISLYNILGIKFLETETLVQQTILNLSFLPKGIYFITFKNDKFLFLTKKIIIQ